MRADDKRQQLKDFPAQRKSMFEQLRAWRKAVGAQMPLPNPKYKSEKEN